MGKQYSRPGKDFIRRELQKFLTRIGVPVTAPVPETDKIVNLFGTHSQRRGGAQALAFAGWFNPSATTHRESRCLSAPGLLGFGFGFPSEPRPVLALADPHARHLGVCQMSDLADPRRRKISRFKARLGVLRTRDLICRWVLLQRPDPPRAPRLGGRVSRYNGDKARSLDGRSW